MRPYSLLNIEQQMQLTSWIAAFVGITILSILMYIVYKVAIR
jgi:hypothetical protein